MQEWRYIIYQLYPMKKYIIEFIGTFFLVLVVALTGNPIAIGAVLIALVYMGGYISGAHYNPAVTVGFLICKKMKAPVAARYMIAQFLGSIAASAIFFVITKVPFTPTPGINVPLHVAILVEILFTFLLVSVVLHVAATDKTKGNYYYGLAIGFTILAAVYAGGRISGGAYNPAVGVGPLIFDITHFTTHMVSLLVYLIGPFAGAFLASLVYKMK